MYILFSRFLTPNGTNMLCEASLAAPLSSTMSWKWQDHLISIPHKESQWHIQELRWHVQIDASSTVLVFGTLSRSTCLRLLYVLDFSDIIIRTIHFSYRQFLDTSLDADVPNIVRNVPKCQNVRVGQDIINCSRECKTKNEHMSFKMKINSFGSRYNMSLSQSRVQLLAG